jgi:hypothetical protein
MVSDLIPGPLMKQSLAQIGTALAARAWKLAAAAFVGGVMVLVVSTLAERGSPVSYQSVTQAAPISIRAGYVAVMIDRTRTKVCASRNTRILIRDEMIGGQKTPVILPLNETGSVFPFKGRGRFVLLVPLPSNLPPGAWSTQTIVTDYCHWWDFLTGGTVRLSPLIPISSETVSAAKDAP